MGKSAAGQGRTDREEVVAITLKSASRIVGVSEQRLINWSKLELLKPGHSRKLSVRNTVRLYTFEDVLALMVIRELLNNRMTTAQIRKVVEYLRKDGYSRPLTELRFAVEGHQIFFQHSDGSWQGARRLPQIVFHQVLDLQILRNRIWESIDRPRPVTYQGKVEQRRKVQGHRRVFAGTRVPVESVVQYLQSGASEREILEAFPSLEKADVRSARAEAKLVNA